MILVRKGKKHPWHVYAPVRAEDGGAVTTCGDKVTRRWHERFIKTVGRGNRGPVPLPRNARLDEIECRLCLLIHTLRTEDD